MKTLKKILFLSTLIAICSLAFATTTQAQTRTRTNSAPAMVFNAEQMGQWHTAKIPARVPNGETVLATNKRNRTQIIAKVRDGRIVAVGYKPVGKTFTALSPNAGKCLPAGICFSFQIPHCFTLPWGDCVCICGSWITAG